MRAVTLDLDGTLAEVRWRRIGLWRQLLRWPRVLGAYEPAVRSLRGRRVQDGPAALVAEVVARCGEPEGKVREALDEAIGRAWPRLFRGATVPAHVLALIDAIDAAGLPRALVSDHPALDKLEALGVGGWAAVVDCTALGALKPLPDGIHAAAAQLGFPAGQILHVGDRWDTDGLAAAAAGCAFLHVDLLGDAWPAPLERRG